MSEVTRLHGGEIFAAIKFDAAAPRLLATAAGLAATARKPLRLVHVRSTELPMHARAYADLASLRPGYEGGFGVEYELTQMNAGDGSGRGDDGSMRDLLPDASALALAKRSLDQMAARYAGETLQIATEVLTGDFPDALLELAEARGAALLVTGAATTQPGFLKGKLRHVYKLMGRAAVPVLVLPDAQSALHLPARRLRLLIADDLTPTSLPALGAAASLLKLLGCVADVLHGHVAPQPAAGFALSPDYQLELWPGVSVKDRPLDDHHEALLGRMRDRAIALREVVAASGGTYEAHLWQGKVGEELSRAVAAHHADISVFGQHHFFHKDQVAFGQLPFAQMLGVDSAILVAPPTP